MYFETKGSGNNQQGRDRKVLALLRPAGGRPRPPTEEFVRHFNYVLESNFVSVGGIITQCSDGENQEQ